MSEIITMTCEVDIHLDNIDDLILLESDIEDLDDLSILYSEGFSGYIPKEENIREELMFFLDYGYNIWKLVKVSTREIIGAGISVLGKNIIELSGITVKDSYRNQGFGEYLIKSLINRIRLFYNCYRIYVRLELINKVAYYLYSKIGFKTY